LPIDTLTTSRAEGESPDKRQEILDVAASFFLSYGFEGASVNAMARHSGISKESFYRYFRGKEDLFTAVIDQELASYQDNITQLTEHWDETDMHESLYQVARTMLTVIVSDRQRALRRLVFNEVLRDPKIGAHYYRIGPQLAYGSLTDYFAQRADETGFEPGYLANAFISILLHGPMLARNCGVKPALTAAEIDIMARSNADLFIQAFFKPEA
jgi:AcrR family transcriptional regulator